MKETNSLSLIAILDDIKKKRAKESSGMPTFRLGVPDRAVDQVRAMVDQAILQTHLETGVLIENFSIEPHELDHCQLFFGDVLLECLAPENQGTPYFEDFLNQLKAHSWKTISISKVHQRLRDLWQRKPELHLAASQYMFGTPAYENVTAATVARALIYLLQRRYSIREFDYIVEQLVIGNGEAQSWPKPVLETLATFETESTDADDQLVSSYNEEPNQPGGPSPVAAKRRSPFRRPQARSKRIRKARIAR